MNPTAQLSRTQTLAPTTLALAPPTPQQHPHLPQTCLQLRSSKKLPRWVQAWARATLASHPHSVGLTSRSSSNKKNQLTCTLHPLLLLINNIPVETIISITTAVGVVALGWVCPHMKRWQVLGFTITTMCRAWWLHLGAAEPYKTCWWLLVVVALRELPPLRMLLVGFSAALPRKIMTTSMVTVLITSTRLWKPPPKAASLRGGKILAAAGTTKSWREISWVWGHSLTVTFWVSPVLEIAWAPLLLKLKCLKNHGKLRLYTKRKIF